jgi:UDP-glucose 4-epimerase
VPIVVDVALGRRDAVTVFGSDYDTPDGTCVRDYIHVLDLCEAHLVALEHLASGGEGGAFNLGTGEGHSVAQVIEVVRRVSGREVRVVHGPRRPGDPPRLVASPERAARILGWRARRVRLDDIVRDLWQVRSARA